MGRKLFLALPEGKDTWEEKFLDSKNTSNSKYYTVETVLVIFLTQFVLFSRVQQESMDGFWIHASRRSDRSAQEQQQDLLVTVFIHAKTQQGLS